ncbi:E3 ubiquitin ligase [Marasmius tenuissimus]|uniref:E3 ubiquitin ligase n=1 Tax=Marasmius tenuissimus TaxID=585030 RepID=A0ABR2Z7V9_9AGAR
MESSVDDTPASGLTDLRILTTNEDMTHVASLVSSAERMDLSGLQREHIAHLTQSIETNKGYMDALFGTLACGICLDILREPRTVACCGSSFCGQCILKWRKTKLGLRREVEGKVIWLDEPRTETFQRGKVKCPLCTERLIFPPIPSSRLKRLAEDYLAKEGIELAACEDEIAWDWPVPHPIMIQTANARYLSSFPLTSTSSGRQIGT